MSFLVKTKNGLENRELRDMVAAVKFANSLLHGNEGGRSGHYEAKEIQVFEITATEVDWTHWIWN